LERWSGASQQPESAASNSYLYSNFGAAPTMRVYIVPRRVAVLAASGLVLVVGIGLLRSPPRRQLRWMGELALAAAVAAVVGVALAPETAVLVGQCAALGVGCVFVLWLIARIESAARRRPAAVVGSSVSRSRDRNSTRPMLPAGQRSSHASVGTTSPPVSAN
jgi:hypothetical protein